jgi:hypothetical protein
MVWVVSSQSWLQGSNQVICLHIAQALGLIALHVLLTLGLSVGVS